MILASLRYLLLVAILLGVLPPLTTLAENQNSPCLVDADDSGSTPTADEQAEPTLDGRLGGQIASWDDIYGPGSATPTENVFS